MATLGGPNIVQDSLVLHLDAANSKSYTGGTQWRDLSGNDRHYNMFGTVPYLQESNGCWDFTSLGAGTSASSPLGFTGTGTTFLTPTGSFTINAWINQTADYGQVGLFSNAGGGDGVRFGPSAGGVYYLIGPTYFEGVIGAGSFALGKWTLITAVYDRQSSLNALPYVYAYVNGRLVGSVLQSTQTTMNTTVPGIVRNPCCQRFVGKLASIVTYNKALTAEEVLQNYNATKGRYNL